MHCYQTIRLKSLYPVKFYTDSPRRIRCHDARTDKTLIFLTNNFLLPALTIAHLYKCCCRVGLVFNSICVSGNSMDCHPMR